LATKKRIAKINNNIEMISKKTSSGNAGIKKAIKIISADLSEAEKRLQNNEKKEKY
jgi:hypothetical protein